MLRRAVAVIFGLTMLACAGLGQEKFSTIASGEVKLADQPAYRLDFVIKELDDTKVINSRSYSMTLVSSGLNPGTGQRSSYGRIKAGYKLPVSSEKGPIYLDAGVEISASLYETQSGGLVIQNNTEVTSVAPPSEGMANAPAPILRSMTADAKTDITPGKAVLLSSVDDPASRHRFQVEVVATKLK